MVLNVVIYFLLDFRKKCGRSYHIIFSYSLILEIIFVRGNFLLFLLSVLIFCLVLFACSDRNRSVGGVHDYCLALQFKTETLISQGEIRLDPEPGELWHPTIISIITHDF